jgi:hypothetical protein
MRAALGITVLTLAACASGGSHPESARPASESVRVVGETGLNIRMAGSEGAAMGTVAFAPDKVWGVLPAVFDSLGIPIGTLDPQRHLIGNTGFNAYQRLGKTSLSKLIDCGRTQGFPSADSYDVYLQITTQVTPKDAGSAVSTLVEAAGRPMVVKGDYIKCSSLGVIESSILAAVRARLTKG